MLRLRMTHVWMGVTADWVDGWGWVWASCGKWMRRLKEGLESKESRQERKERRKDEREREKGKKQASKKE